MCVAYFQPPCLMVILVPTCHQLRWDECDEWAEIKLVTCSPESLEKQARSKDSIYVLQHL